MDDITLKNFEICPSSPWSCFDKPQIKIEAAIRINSPKIMNKIVSHEAAGQYQKLRQDIVELIAGAQSKVKRILFNDKATILFWDDGEKTVVKCHECDPATCLFDQGIDPTSDTDGLIAEAIIDPTTRQSKVAQLIFCQKHFDRQKAVMAGMLKRLYPNFQDVLRENGVE